MRVQVKKRLIWNVGNAKKPEIIDVGMADRIAMANGNVYAERFVKEHDGQVLRLNDDTLKIEGVVK